MSVESRTKKMLRASSRKWNILFGIILAMILAFGLFLRFYAFEPVKVVGNALSPKLSHGSLVWICKLTICTNKLSYDDIVLVSLPGQSTVLRSVFGMPGDSIRITPNGKIQTESREFTWEDESEIIAPRNFYVPKKGDSITFASLNDLSFDYASDLLRQEFGFRNFYVKATLFRNRDILPISRVGSTHIFGRPVSTREINGFHWQEYFLIGLQIDREDPGAKPVHFERKIYNVKDSCEVKGFRSVQNTYYLICTQGSRCEDSRLFGYIPQNQIKGKVFRVQTLFQR